MMTTKENKHIILHNVMSSEWRALARSKALFLQR